MNENQIAGKDTFLLIVGILLILPLISLIVSVDSGNFARVQLNVFRLLLDLFLYYMIYIGKEWAKWLVSIFLFIGVSYSALVIILDFNITNLLINGLFIIVYLFVINVLLTSKNLNEFLDYQRNTRKNKEIES